MTTLSTLTSSRSSSSLSCRRSRMSAIGDALAAPAGVDQDARERDEPREALRADRRLGAALLALTAARALRGFSPSSAALVPRLRRAGGGSSSWRSRSRSSRSRSSPASSAASDQARVDAEAEHPGDEAARVGVGRDEHALSPSSRPSPSSALALELRGVEHLAVASEVPFDLPGDPLGDQDPRLAALLAELPVGAVRVGARVEVRRPVEVVLGLRRVGDLAADPRQPEDANRVALVRVAEQVELAALEQQVVGVDLARRDLVAAHRVVVEHDRLVAEDRRLDLRQARGELVTAGRGGDAERHRPLLGSAQRARDAPR